MSHKDPVTPELRIAILRRDSGCIAADNHHLVRRLFALHPHPAEDACRGRLTLQHVKDQPRTGKRAPSDPEHLVVVCEHHHLDGWATSREALRFQRDYLRRLADPSGLGELIRSTE